MPPKLLTLRLPKFRESVKLLLLITLSVIANRLLWERLVLLRNLAQIEQVLGAFNLALKEQEVEVAYAQCLPAKHGGELSLSEVYAMSNSRYRHVFPFYVRTEVAYYWKSGVRPIWIENQIILEADVIGRVIYDGPDSFYFRAILRKWNNQWYIVSFPIS